MLHEALELAERGWHILPVGKDKMPVTEHGFLDATTDRTRIEEWYNRGLLTNIAVSCAASGMFVLDIDPRNGGYETLNALVEAHGNLPYTVSSKTAGNGQHYFFRLPEGAKLRGRLGMGIDVKSKGYAILPPSENANGGSYAWTTSPQRATVADAPDWLQSLVVKPQAEVKPFTPGELPPDPRPGDRYNAETSWESILRPLGWVVDHSDGEETYWTRPGKDEGISATTNYAGTGLMYVFTSSTELESDQCYTPFNFLAVTQYNGDHSAAARDLAERYRDGIEPQQWVFGQAGTTNQEPTVQLALAVPKYSFEPAFDAGHFVAKYIRWCGDQSDAAHEYAEASALVLLSAVTQFNRINLSAFPGGLHTNLYAMLVGPSTKSRKSTIQRMTGSMLKNVANGAALPSKMTTEALINELASRSGMPAVWLPDEFGILLSQIMRRDYLKGVEEMLLSVYGGDNYSYLKADGSTTRVTQPHLSLLAAATPESLAFAGPQATMSGLMPRFAMVYPPALPTLRPVGEMPELDTAELTKHLMEIRNWAHIPPAELTFERAALTALNDAEMSILERGLSVARLPAMLYKVAALSALGAKRKDVQLSDATSAIKVVDRWVSGAERLAPVLLRKTGDYDFQRAAEEAYAILQKRGGVAHRSTIAEELKTTKARMTQLQDALQDWNYIQIDAPAGNWIDKRRHNATDSSTRPTYSGEETVRNSQDEHTGQDSA